jgi:hypothetical protein
MAERGRAKKLFDETVAWFADRNDDWIFSFVSICETLDLNPEYMRGGLLRWKEKKLARTHAPSQRTKSDGWLPPRSKGPFMKLSVGKHRGQTHDFVATDFSAK